MRLKFVLAAVISMLAPPNLGWGQAFVEHLNPPVIRRGTTNRIVVSGTDTGQAAGLWTSISGEPIVARVVGATEDGAMLELEPRADSPLGVYGLRLATRSGLSNVHLFVVDELPVVSRSPDSNGEAIVPVSLPVSVTGVCRAATIDRYSIAVGKGQRVAFEVVGNRLGKDYDPLVQIRDASGKLIAACDNSVGLLFDCRFAFQFPEAGTYTVEVRDSRFEGDDTWHYVLRMGDFPEARVAVPSAVLIGETTLSFPQLATWQFPLTVDSKQGLRDIYQDIRLSPDRAGTWIPLTITDLPTSRESEPNDTTATATAAHVPGTLNGLFDRPGDRDWYSFELTKDQKLTFQGVAKAMGSAADLELVLFDVDGREVRRVDDNELDEGGFAYTAGKAGLHRLQVREMARDGGPEFAYRVDVRAGGPHFQLSAEAADLTVSRGSYQALPVKVTRTEFNGEIRLELQGAPTGISLQPTVIPANATEFVARVIADANTPEGISSLRLVGTATLENGGHLQSVAKTTPMIDRQLKNVDLIPYGLRENQRRLPPSLQQQIALMVVPPAPFEAELPEAIVSLTRFQTAEFSIATTRQPGFTSPITFAVKGGQIGNEQEERNQVYARFVPGAADRLTATGTFYNRINTQLSKHRVDLTASAEWDGRRINLVRTFALDVRSAFRPTYEPEVPAATPGGTVRVKLVANRVSTFDGPLRFALGPQAGLVFPATVEIPAGQPAVEMDVKVDSKLNPGRHGIRVEVAGFVGKYEENLNLPNLQIDVQKPAQ